MKKRFVLYIIIVTAAIILTFLPVSSKRSVSVQDSLTVNEVKKEGGTEYGLCQWGSASHGKRT